MTASVSASRALFVFETTTNATQLSREGMGNFCPYFKLTSTGDDRERITTYSFTEFRRNLAAGRTPRGAERESLICPRPASCLFCCGSVRLGSVISTLGVRDGFESDLGMEKKLVVKIDKRGCVFPGLVPWPCTYYCFCMSASIN